MSYVFTASEQQELSVVRKICPETKDDGGNFVPLYQKLSEIIGRHLSDDSLLDINTRQQLKSAKLWLDVAIGANGNIGMHSAFIRAYTNREGELRLGTGFSLDDMQRASNAVAVNLWNSLVQNQDPSQNLVVPSIDKIASADAAAIGVELYGQYPNDTALTANAAWSGAIGFNLLGGVSPWETWRLTTAGESGFDTLDDFKNILFAVDAYDKALKAGFQTGGLEFASYLSDLAGGNLIAVLPEDLMAQANIAIASGKINPFIKSVASGSPIATYVNVIADLGVNELLDMLRRSVYGNGVSKTVTDDDFKTNALAFFNQMGDTQQYGMKLSADDLVNQSKTDFTAMAALNAASVFRFTGSAAIERLQNSNYDLYTKWQQDQLDTKADEYGTRNFSDKWRADRAKLIEALREGSYARSDNANQLFIEDKTLQRSFLLAPEGFFADPSGANPTVLGTDQIIFGSDAANDTFAGAAGDDHLYGGDGSDTLDGGAGDDYVEGNAGSDSLLGGTGNDILLGGSGDDTLNGGTGNDTLKGGAGYDTYVMHDGDGGDTVIDSDGQGKIIWGGNAFAFRQSDRIGNSFQCGRLQ
jgi:Ca2+-binding RTX toxin-like protein